jgi:tRNA(Ile)-lysidine synthase
VAACAELGLRPWQDPTNLVGPGLRSRVRHELLPLLAEVLGPGVPQALARTADQCREAAEVLDGLAAELLVAAGLAVPHGDAAAAPGDSTPTRSATSAIAGPVEAPSWEVAVLAAAPVGVRRAALHRLALTVGAVPGSLSRAHVLALDRLVVEWHGQGPVDLPGGPRLVRECGRLLLARPGTVPAAG